MLTDKAQVFGTLKQIMNTLLKKAIKWSQTLQDMGTFKAQEVSLSKSPARLTQKLLMLMDSAVWR